MKILSIVQLIIALFIITSPLYGQSDLTIFDDFIGKEWTGHFQNSEDSLLVHKIEWEYDLNKQVVKETKVVPEVSFQSETYYYWDYETDQIAYLSLVNKKMISKGTVITENGKLELSGKTFFRNGFQENKKTFEIAEDGNLKDYFFRKTKGNWLQGHFILYTAE